MEFGSPKPEVQGCRVCGCHGRKSLEVHRRFLGFKVQGFGTGEAIQLDKMTCMVPGYASPNVR